METWQTQGSLRREEISEEWVLSRELTVCFIRHLLINVDHEFRSEKMYMKGRKKENVEKQEFFGKVGVIRPLRKVTVSSLRSG